MADIYLGDILKCPPPVCPDVRLRVREVKRYPTGVQYRCQLYTLSIGGGGYSWFDRSYDLFIDHEEIGPGGYELAETAKIQLEMFA